LDAQYFGVPQRRRRVFVVAHLENGPHPAEVLFEPESLRGDTAKGGKARKGSPRGAGKGAPSGREPSRINCQPDGIAGTVSVKWVKGSGGPAGDEHYNMVVQPLVTDARGLGDGLVAPTLQPTLTMAVRRLLPVECERLQGFPDDHTNIPWRGKPAPDGPRYKSMGNSMAVPVMRWIGERLDRVAKGDL